MTFWQGLIIGFLLGAYFTFAASAYAFSRMRVSTVISEWVIAGLILTIASLFFWMALDR